MLKVLVDFENLPNEFKDGSLQQLAVTISSNKEIKKLSAERIDVKLYSGWFENDKPTKKCQILKSVDSSFKFRLGKTIQRVNFSLAYTLESNINSYLFRTFRKSSFSKQLHYISGKSPHNCDIKSAIDTLNMRQCADPKCDANDDSVAIFEQKLVDSMIVCDLVFLSQTNNCSVCIISSDDDMVPGIITALSYGKVIHLWTKTQPNSKYQAIYQNINNYSGSSLI